MTMTQQPIPPINLKLLSYNIQLGIPTQAAHQYITGSWRHLFHDKHRLQNLNQIASVLESYDLVALQEVDLGSLRSGYINQIEYLAEKAGFPYWHSQRNRNFGKFAQHSSGVLTKLQAIDAVNYKLPGMLPGRGAIKLTFGRKDNPLVLISLHLSLGKRSQLRQLAFVAELVNQHEHVIVMGDMNCPLHRLMEQTALKDTQLRPVNYTENTFPSWRPRHNIDQILLTPSLQVLGVEVLSHRYSDHLPVGLDLSVPGEILAIN